MIDLPIIHVNRAGKVSLDCYNKLLWYSQRIFAEINPCWVDEEGYCNKYRSDQDPEMKTCCDHHKTTYYWLSCKHLGEQWCTTQNLACSQVLCDVAKANLSPRQLEGFEEYQQKVENVLKQGYRDPTSAFFVHEDEIKRRIIKKVSEK